MRLYLCLISFIIVFAGCGGSRVALKDQTGEYAKTVFSPRYDYEGRRRIAVLPFVNEGKEGTDIGVADKLSAKLMGAGFTVIDRSQLEALFQELKLNFTGALSNENIKKLGEMLSVDMLVFGTLSYDYIPAQSSANLYFASSQGAYHELSNESVRFVDVETGAVVITSFCCEKGYKGSSMAVEIGESIKRKLLQSR